MPRFINAPTSVRSAWQKPKFWDVTGVSYGPAVLFAVQQGQKRCGICVARALGHLQWPLQRLKISVSKPRLKASGSIVGLSVQLNLLLLWRHLAGKGLQSLQPWNQEHCFSSVIGWGERCLVNFGAKTSWNVHLNNEGRIKYIKVHRDRMIRQWKRPMAGSVASGVDPSSCASDKPIGLRGIAQNTCHARPIQPETVAVSSVYSFLTLNSYNEHAWGRTGRWTKCS
jgi:hypothetical protein